MKMKTTLKILMCTSALAFTTIGTASAHQHESGEAAASQMKEKAKDKAVDMATDEAKEMMKKEEHTMEHSMQEKATGMAMDKAKGVAKDKVLGEAGSGVAGQVEHKMKEKAMDNAMDKAADHAKGMVKKEGGDEAAGTAEIEFIEVAGDSEAKMPEKAQGVVMGTPAVENAAPQSQPAKLLTFDEALSVCRGQAALQACIDEKTGQGAARAAIHRQNIN
jgi:hypothetical protein